MWKHRIFRTRDGQLIHESDTDEDNVANAMNRFNKDQTEGRYCDAILVGPNWYLVIPINKRNESDIYLYVDE